jgi:hypothetical protein
LHKTSLWAVTVIVSIVIFVVSSILSIVVPVVAGEIVAEEIHIIGLKVVTFSIRSMLIIDVIDCVIFISFNDLMYSIHTVDKVRHNACGSEFLCSSIILLKDLKCHIQEQVLHYSFCLFKRNMTNQSNFLSDFRLIK